MQNQMDRTLTILADDEHVTGYARARLLGAEPVSYTHLTLPTICSV